MPDRNRRALHGYIHRETSMRRLYGSDSGIATAATNGATAECNGGGAASFDSGGQGFDDGSGGDGIAPMHLGRDQA